MIMRKHHPSHGSRAAGAGFTLIELAIVIAVLGLLLVPLLKLTAASFGATREQATTAARDALIAQNVFVLIAPGDNRNADLNRTYFRDSNHRGNASGSSWSANSSNNLDLVVFSGTPNVDATDEGSDGDDTLLVMSFVNFKAEMNRYGLNMEAVCDGTC